MRILYALLFTLILIGGWAESTESIDCSQSPACVADIALAVAQTAQGREEFRHRSLCEQLAPFLLISAIGYGLFLWVHRQPK